MAHIHLRICPACARKLLAGNPFIDNSGKTIPFKGIKINRVESQYCELHQYKEDTLKDIRLDKYLCRHCSKEFYLIPKKDIKQVCPSCRSTYMSKL